MKLRDYLIVLTCCIGGISCVVNFYLYKVIQNIDATLEHIDLLSQNLPEDLKCTCQRNKGTTLSCEVHQEYKPGIVYR